MNLCEDLIKEILDYLPNEDIFNMSLLNNYNNKLITEKSYIEHIIYRSHPVVFNNIDNFCSICNLKLIFLCDLNNIIRCNHLT